MFENPGGGPLPPCLPLPTPMPPEDTIRMKQAVEVLILCFYCTVYVFRSENYLRAIC